MKQTYKKRFTVRNAESSNLQRKPKGRQSKITNYFESKNQETIKHISINDEYINCFQSNNQKRIESCEKLAYYCDKLPSFLVLGQEPSMVGMTITGLNGRHARVHGLVQRPRAYVYLHKNIRTWPLDHLCDQDVAATLLDLGKQGGDRILACSIYWDGRISTFPENAIRAMKLANAKGYTLLLGGDLNARNVIYGSNITDTRGKIFEQILIQNNLTTLNIGTVPTCTASQGGSVIDVTTITSGMEDIISDWRVSKLESH